MSIEYLIDKVNVLILYLSEHMCLLFPLSVAFSAFETTQIGERKITRCKWARYVFISVSVKTTDGISCCALRKWNLWVFFDEWKIYFYTMNELMNDFYM